MRIRKGHRSLQLAPADQTCLQEDLGQRDQNAHGIDAIKVEAHSRRLVKSAAAAAAPADVAATSGFQELQEHANGTSAKRETGLECNLEANRVSVNDTFDERSSVQNTVDAGSPDDGHSNEGLPPIAVDGKLSISSIIRAGVAPGKTNSPSALACAHSISTSDTSLVKDLKDAIDCSPPMAMKVADQSNLLLQSLKLICLTAANTGLTAKEAVTKVRELGLPGLNEGGERLIVQVAKTFRSSSLFVEREERGRYFIQDSASPKEWGDSDADEAIVSREKAVSTEVTEVEKTIEAARQLQNLQRIQEDGGNREGVTSHSEKSGGEVKTGADRRGVTLRSKSSTRSSSSQKTSLSGDQSGPRCNRDDGKGWRCFRPAEVGFSLCKYHRDQIRRADIRRRKSRNKSKEQSLVQSPVKTSKLTLKNVVKPSPVSEVDTSVDVNSIDSDDELLDSKRRKFVKAKSLKSIL
ncbi:uncharacterized protein [Physcomitrium patens]|uniref:WRC domain-containing protein n=1 Tax=Physcomitrium patens TaxID=3218 RepID=A0A7I4CUE5_PHYPA|nr:uncharacterized protein LOC112277025 isoform X2 [Physcomitrium patens]|eukprot:XP_024364745.1 uncharacterized protein LOC112277025 isoform X2 [Physcomitrella patens]